MRNFVKVLYVFEAEIDSLVLTAHLIISLGAVGLELGVNDVSVRQFHVVASEQSLEVRVTEFSVVHSVASGPLDLIQIFVAHELVGHLKALAVDEGLLEVQPGRASHLHVLVVIAASRQMAFRLGVRHGHRLMHCDVRSRHRLRRANVPASLVYALTQEETNTLFSANAEEIGDFNATVFPEEVEFVFAEPLVELFRHVSVHGFEADANVVVHRFRELAVGHHSVSEEAVFLASLLRLVVDKLLREILFHLTADFLL